MSHSWKRAAERGACLIDAPGGARTPNLLIRSQMLYPIELRALAVAQSTVVVSVAGLNAASLRLDYDDTLS